MKLNRRGFLKVSAGTTGLILLHSPKKASAQDSPNKSAKAVLVDVTKCVGCWACYAACKREHNLPGKSQLSCEHPPELESNVWSTLSSTENGNERLCTKRQCMHCVSPACVEACPLGALEKTASGPVIHNEQKCFGCRYCMVACPFGVPNFEWEDPVPTVRKCDFCADRLAKGLEPACVAACPTGALKFGNREELITEARERIKAAPREYIDHIYGEKEAGGTSWLYLSSVAFESLGLPTLGSEPVAVNAERAMGAVPPVLLAVTATMAGVYALTQRRRKMRGTKDGKDEGGGAITR